MKNQNHKGRRKFIQNTAILSAGLVTAPLLSFAESTEPMDSDNIYLIGPQKGFSSQIGTLLSTMTMMRKWLIDTVKDLSIEELDFQIDDKSNSIGALLLHLAATERYYQLNTFDELDWGSWSSEVKNEWNVASALGEKGRKQIVGNDIDFYLTKLEKVRSETIKQFGKRKDDWLFELEPFFEQKITNNYCKWFHVCEHESNHRGQIKLIIKRLPTE